MPSLHDFDCPSLEDAKREAAALIAAIEPGVPYSVSITKLDDGWRNVCITIGDAAPKEDAA